MRQEEDVNFKESDSSKKVPGILIRGPFILNYIVRNRKQKFTIKMLYLVAFYCKFLLFSYNKCLHTYTVS